MAGPVEIQGLRQLRRDLKRLEPEVDRELRKDLKAAGEKVARDARSRAPKVTGEYARSIRVYVTAKGVAIGSNLPQSKVLHWGGTIRPRGVPITFRPRPVVQDAVDRRENEIVEDLGDAVDRAARKVGWR